MEKDETLRRRVLVADDVESLARLMEHLLTKRGFEVEIALDGLECLKKIKTFQPELVILDIMMPRLHGLDTLKEIRSDPQSRNIGVIICSSKSFKPDQAHAREMGIFDFIVKPFQPEELLRKVEMFFSGSGAIEPVAAELADLSQDEPFLPELDSSRGIIHLWGTRGSIPVSGRNYVHHGGNTSCVSFEHGEEIIIFDAGTGIRGLGARLAREKPRRVHLFIGHTHWDHIQGFPFFAPAYIPGFELTIYGASGFGKDLKSVFQGQLDRDYFPVQMEDMRAQIEFIHLSQNPVNIGEFQVHWILAHHPGATLNFKIVLNGKSIGYISDNEFLLGYLGHPADITAESELLAPYLKFVEFLTGVDLLIGEAQYPNDEYRSKIGWGHSSVSNASVLAKLAGVRKWIVTHHDPMHDDEFLMNKLNLHAQVLDSLGHAVDLMNAFDGQRILI